MSNHRPLDWKNDDAVSAVIGAVLVFGLVSSAFIMWSFTTLPVWVSDNEQARNMEVEDGLRGLSSGMDLLVADGSSGPIARSIPLSAAEVPLLQPAPSLGSLAFEDGFGWSGTFNGSISHMLDEVVDGIPTEDINGDVITDIGSLDSITLALTASINNNREAVITMVADDGASTITATLALRGSNMAGNSCGSTELVFTVASDLSSSDRVTTNCGFGTDLTDFPFSPMNSEYGFGSQVRRLDPGYSITLTDNAFADGTFGAAWTDPDGFTQVLGAGTSVGTVNRDATGGRIVFDPVDLAYLDQTIIWEGGSIIRQQSEGGIVALSPGFDLRVDGTTGYLRWTVLDLEGTGDISGRGHGNIALTSHGFDSQLLTCDDGIITIDTPYVDAWANHLRAATLVAGAESSTSIQTGADQVSLSLLDAGGVTEWRVYYRVLSADVVVS